MLRLIFISLAGGGGSLLLEYLVVRFVPLLGIVFWIPTLIGLSVLEDCGLPTLQGSPDGWPMATSLGAVITGIAWWFIWSVIVAIALWRKRPNWSADPKGKVHEG
jgi:hypothetical protein